MTAAHYEREGLIAALREGLARAGKQPGGIIAADLAPVDQFHTGGIDATRRLAQRAGVQAHDRVLDVGGGLGGAARVLAEELAARATVLDATAAYCAAGEMLNDWTQASVRFVHGDALAMPFDDASFDLVFTQHAAMNIADRASLYREIARVIRPGGRFALHDILAGDVQPVHFPVPWATRADASFLVTLDTLRTHLGNSGLVEEQSWDETAEALAWFARRPQAAPPPLGLHLLLGEDFPAMFANQVRNLNERRIRIVQAVWRKPG